MILKTGLLSGMKVTVKSLPVGSLLLDVCTWNVGEAFVLLTATSTGEPTAMAGGGAITVRPFAASTFKVAAGVVAGVPILLVRTAWYCVPFSALAAVVV